MSATLSDKQREAMLMLQEIAERFPAEESQGVTTSSESFLDVMFPAFIHWQTADALRRRGLIDVEWNNMADEGGDVILTVDGHVWKPGRS